MRDSIRLHVPTKPSSQQLIASPDQLRLAIQLVVMLHAMNCPDLSVKHLDGIAERIGEYACQEFDQARGLDQTGSPCRCVRQDFFSGLSPEPSCPFCGGNGWEA